MTNPVLPVIENCEGCSACCQRTPVPPFEPGEEAAHDVPESALQLIRDRISRDEQFELLPCVWLNPLNGLCRHYELRPQACRDFSPGSQLCRLCRDDEGVR
jgi:Fe-S-cluster containining protein